MGISNLVGVSPHVFTIMTHPGSDEKQAPCLLASSLVYFLGGLGGTAAPLGRTQTQGRFDAQSSASRAHLVERSGLLCPLQTGSVGAAGSAGERSRLAGL